MPVERKTRFNLAYLLIARLRLLLSRMGGPGASVMAFGKNREKRYPEEFERLAGCGAAPGPVGEAA